MDKVFKCVGISKVQSNMNIRDTNGIETNDKLRRRRRNTSRHRTIQDKNAHGLFSIDWEFVKDCQSCRCRVISRKLCNRKCENELYKSNSFKFEKFIRDNEEVFTLGRKILLCEDYSLPVDNLKKKDTDNVTVSKWEQVQQKENQVEVLETYSNPLDSMKQLIEENQDNHCIAKRAHRYSYPYKADNSSEISSDGEADAKKVIELDSSPHEGCKTKIHYSPYYYSDLYKKELSRSGKQLSEPERQTPKEVKKKCKTNSNRERTNWEKKSSEYDARNANSKHCIKKDEQPCMCFVNENLIDNDMTRQRHVYETAFDSKINRSDDDLDNTDKICNHAILTHINRKKKPSTPNIGEITTNRIKSMNELSHQLENVHLDELSTDFTPIRHGNVSPPSTAPLPLKFHPESHSINSISSTPNLPFRSGKDYYLPSKSGEIFSKRRSMIGMESHALNTDEVKKDFDQKEEKDLCRVRNCQKRQLFLLKRYKGKRRDPSTKMRTVKRGDKYSSTESVITSSSGGSVESIRSSTSEGNRSTTSSDSCHSSSLSSHSSDSGKSIFTKIQTHNFLMLPNKLQVLSPISDKSQEPMSELSDSRTCDRSEKCSPDARPCPEHPAHNFKPKLPQNKNLVTLSYGTNENENQGSDSGISIQSREGVRSRFDNNPDNPNHSPFDIAKLRRKRLGLGIQDPCTSSSTTCMEFHDLPFDMPKLRRRLKFESLNTELSASQGSSTQSISETKSNNSFRPTLTLHLSMYQEPRLKLSLVGMFNKSDDKMIESIDVNLPLEKQSWFHGAITRIEAENILRVLNEGSFLVRNSESTKQDYSLSLKSTKGFLHIRIKKDDTGECYILGQFHKPFQTIPEMIRHFSSNCLPIRGAEHMYLLEPVISQLL